jgi:hypothetical protein
MGTIVCRHRNETLFDRLSDNYSRYLTFLYEGPSDNDRKMFSSQVEINRLEWDAEDSEKDYSKIKLRWYVSKGNTGERPKKVLKDASPNKDLFISLDGFICCTHDYKPTKEYLDLTEVAKEIASQQPQRGNLNSVVRPDIKHKVLKFDEIPSARIFNQICGRDFDYGFMYSRVSKYNRESLNKDVDRMRGIMCPFVEDGFYENINFYEDDAIWYNPNSKFVQINHAVTNENFFDKDGYLCSVSNYRHVTAEEVQIYKKIFLFLV